MKTLRYRNEIAEHLIRIPAKWVAEVAANLRRHGYIILEARNA